MIEGIHVKWNNYSNGLFFDQKLVPKSNIPPNLSGCIISNDSLQSSDQM